MSPPPGPPRLIGLPYDASSSYLRGPAAAPPLIRAALRSPHGNSWSEAGVDLDGPSGLTDEGDLALPETAQARAQIEAAIGSLLRAGHRPLGLGGDHSVTYPVVRALAPFVANLTVLHLDAHPDLYEAFGGDRFSHASPFARIMEERLAARLVQVGIRTMNAEQQRQVDRFGVEVIDMRAWAGGLRPRLQGSVYLSIDLDALDPAFAPGVSHREPGGLSVREAVTLIQSCGGTLVGADVVELNPRQDQTGLSAEVAAKLVRELAGRMVAEAQRGPGA